MPLLDPVLDPALDDDVDPLLPLLDVEVDVDEPVPPPIPPPVPELVPLLVEVPPPLPELELVVPPPAEHAAITTMVAGSSARIPKSFIRVPPRRRGMARITEQESMKGAAPWRGVQV